MTVSINWPSFMIKWLRIHEIYVPKCTAPRVLMPIMMSQRSNLIEWFKISKIEFPRTEHDFSMKKILNFPSWTTFLEIIIF